VFGDILHHRKLNFDKSAVVAVIFLFFLFLNQEKKEGEATFFGRRI
jgi:hypothetical protein